MPIYEFICELCGPFEQRRDPASVADPLRCAGCGAPARRVYSAPMVRSPGDPFACVGQDVRSRVERSHTGEPVVSYGATPPGHPVKRALRPSGHGHRHHGATPPWLIGH